MSTPITFDAKTQCVLLFLGLNLCSPAPAQLVLTNTTNIGYNEYRDRSDLTNVVILDTVTNIDVGAFYGCSNLTSITIGRGVTTIGEVALGTMGRDSGNPWTNAVAVMFMGNAPTNVAYDAFCGWVWTNQLRLAVPCNVTVYARPRTTGWVNPTNWDSTLAGRPVWYASVVYKRDSSPAVYRDGPLLFFQLVARGPITMTDLPIVLEACSDLARPVWTRLATNTMYLADTPSGGYGNCARSFHDLVTGTKTRFYRIRAETIDWP